MRASILLLLLLLFTSSASTYAVAANTVPTGLTLVPGALSFVYLNGPWKFHVGDDPRWAWGVTKMVVDPGTSRSSCGEIGRALPGAIDDQDLLLA